MRRAAPLLVPLLLLAGPAPAPACVAVARPVAQSRPEPPRRSCTGGAETVAFGRMLLDLGVRTLGYGVGILLVFLGLVVMAMGYLLVLIDLLVCW